jgi:trk system potassium uptake protein TrkA
MYVVIAGGGLVGLGLAQRLAEHRHDVVVVDRDKAVCEEICAKIGALAIHGNATHIDVLEEAGMRKAEVAVATMPTDGDNLAFTILSRNFGVPRILARMRNPRYETAYQMAGVTKTINVMDLFIHQLILEIEQPSLRQVATFGGGKAIIAVAAVPEGARAHGKTVAEIASAEDFPKECVIAGIFRDATKEFIIPRGQKDIRAGDHVFLAASGEKLGHAAEFLQRID